MQQDEIYLIDMWRIFVREWRWFVALLMFCLAGTFVVTHLVKSQWSATALIRIGQVGQVPEGEDPKVEPLLRIIERLKWRPFQDEVLKSAGLQVNSAAAGLYRSSLKLDPLPYEGPMIRLTVRGYSVAQATQLAQVTVSHLEALHQRLEAMPLEAAQGRLKKIEAGLSSARAERDQWLRPLMSAHMPGRDNEPLAVSVLLSERDKEIRRLQKEKGDLVQRLGATYTYETSLMWPIYAPRHRSFPNALLMWGIGISLGIFMGVLAATARSAARRHKVSRAVTGAM